jgi:multiple sugar transport system permease protein
MSENSSVLPSGGERLNFIEHMARWLTWRRFIVVLTITFFLTSILFPFYWMASSSFKTYAEIGSRRPVYIPSALRPDAYQELFDASHPSYQRFGINIINTIKISLPTALIAVFLSVLGAYAVTRLRFRGKELMLNGILLVYLFPGILLIIPLFAMLSRIGADVARCAVHAG